MLGNEGRNLRNRLLIGIASFVPLVFLILAVTTSNSGIASLNVVSTVFQISGLVVMAALLIYYVLHVYRNSHVAKETKVLWVIILVLFLFFAFPIYWYVHVWRVPKKSREFQVSPPK
jgi:hypothetical protein